MASKSRQDQDFFHVNCCRLLGSIIFTFKDRLSYYLIAGSFVGKNFINKIFDKKDDTNLAKKHRKAHKKDDADEKNKATLVASRKT